MTRWNCAGRVGPRWRLRGRDAGQQRGAHQRRRAARQPRRQPRLVRTDRSPGALPRTRRLQTLHLMTAGANN